MIKVDRSGRLTARIRQFLRIYTGSLITISSTPTYDAMTPPHASTVNNEDNIQLFEESEEENQMEDTPERKYS